MMVGMIHPMSFAGKVSFSSRARLQERTPGRSGVDVERWRLICLKTPEAIVQNVAVAVSAQTSVNPLAGALADTGMVLD